MNRRFGLSGGVARHMNHILRVPNKFLGIRDLAYLKTGIRVLVERKSEIRDFNYERYTRDLAVFRCEIQEMLL